MTPSSLDEPSQGGIWSASERGAMDYGLCMDSGLPVAEALEGIARQLTVLGSGGARRIQSEGQQRFQR
eukprot:9084477-Alexandrium_andersonii.AAC.1